MIQTDTHYENRKMKATININGKICEVVFSTEGEDTVMDLLKDPELEQHERETVMAEIEDCIVKYKLNLLKEKFQRNDSPNMRLGKKQLLVGRRLY